jgi:hypothetical protein
MLQALARAATTDGRGKKGGNKAHFSLVLVKGEPMSIPPELKSSMAVQELILVALTLICDRLKITDHEIAVAIKQFVSCRAEKGEQ